MKCLNNMTVNLGEIISPSTLDWAGKCSMVIFLNGCNLNCRYCSNHKLLSKQNPVPIQEVYKAIDDNRRLVDSLVLSGGEALCQFEAVQLLARYARAFKTYAWHMNVGLHTNGYDSTAIELLADQGYINAMMLDVKPPQVTPSDYWDELLLSMEAIHEARFCGNLDYVEARLTIFNALNNYPDYVDAVSKVIADKLEPDRLYLQQGDYTLAAERSLWDIDAVSGERLVQLARVAQKNVGADTKVYVRSRGLGEIEIQ